MTDRRKTATVQLKIRMREDLRRQIEKAAKERETSMNAEMLRRLNLPPQLDDRAARAMYAELAKAWAERSVYMAWAERDEQIVEAGKGMMRQFEACEEARHRAEKAEAELAKARAGGERTFPLQVCKDIEPGPKHIPWSIAEKAYGVYVGKYGRCQSLERLAERGGFGWDEMDNLYPKWRAEVGEISELKSELAKAREEVERLKHRIVSHESSAVDAHKLATEWMDRHDQLLGFIQARPDVLKQLIKERAALNPEPADG